jgi:hypothetical protein
MIKGAYPQAGGKPPLLDGEPRRAKRKPLLVLPWRPWLYRSFFFPASDDENQPACLPLSL